MIDTIKLKGIIAEDFCNYKLPSMFLITSICDWKCCKELNFDVSICQNSDLVSTETKEFNIKNIINYYLSNDITKSIVIGGLEPFKQFDEIYSLIKCLREYNCFDDVVIYTGYYPDEIEEQLDQLKHFNNIVIKFGRYIPNKKTRYDEVLGITLASDNQFGERLICEEI